MSLPFPMNEARATEWLMRTTESQPPYAVIRRLLVGDPNRPEEWFRVVTWSPEPTERELIGYVRTLLEASHLGWDHKCAYESWRHHLAAKRTDSATMAAAKPAAADLVRFWRQQTKQAQTVSATALTNS